ncbi:hydrogenase maturation nickel metallochaperone HypA [Methanothermobacter wolfeii]|uniref:Hydrogenase maturation factor HypA n=1 Tax=Methanothermobacter wolfeii TaxID=145261 RepID=A0A9E7UMB6_METWO|nr:MULTISPECIES: hydrogenase maturation nickel metallochaperone HypA [Methanothermobacter]NLM02534.1 hydrogenase maturation nickel metallochaperone HypA [Methanothermobacter wolfeii]QHN06554.1 hydrogenase maturation nickel metallochaperone HypA [Methanothermobacter sp. THM-1]UXH31088.1 hydrogenase maturation nickel metallochaperone HypA [Methanothermobacter wolfeii]SCM57601.1 putative hydrogenase nickel incorporation protein HypA [Methanothermobacter wolfeii]
MHELSMADAIVRTVIDAAEKNDAVEVLEVTVEIGQMTLLNPEQIKFMLDVLSEDTILEGARFNIEVVPVEIECTCGYEGAVDTDELNHLAPVVSCPSCGGHEFHVRAGRECNVKNIKIEKRD